MTRQAVVVRRKMDMPTAVVAMLLGTESLSLPSREFTLGPSADGRRGYRGKCDFLRSEKATPAKKKCCVCISNDMVQESRSIITKLKMQTFNSLNQADENRVEINRE